VSAGDAVVRRWGVISGTTKRLTGHLPPVIDTLFAATAPEHDLYLVTRNVGDVRESEAQIFDPRMDNPAQLSTEPDVAITTLIEDEGDSAVLGSDLAILGSRVTICFCNRIAAVKPLFLLWLMSQVDP
jgi:hypothetical protein